MFINVSNHPSGKWGTDQHRAAAQYGEIVDLPFPAIEPTLDREAVKALAEDYYTRICALVQGAGDTSHSTSLQEGSAASRDASLQSDAAGTSPQGDPGASHATSPQGDPGASHGTSPQDTAVMVSGEYTFTYHLVALLLRGDYHPVSACTRRETVEQTMPDGSVVKTARFVFVQFREY